MTLVSRWKARALAAEEDRRVLLMLKHLTPYAPGQWLATANALRDTRRAAERVHAERSERLASIPAQRPAPHVERIIAIRARANRRQP